MKKSDILPSSLAQQNPVLAGAPAGYDPELLFVECGKCGSPVLWEKGQATRILQSACIDPLELDAHCLLITDGCPHCSQGKVFNVQVYRVQNKNVSLHELKTHGSA